MKDLSFVIIGKNPAWSIARLLDSVIANTPSHLSTEILYVDSASTDRTIEVVSQYPATILQLSADQPLCASAGRYIGSQYAIGKYIFFLDSDMELLDGWLERAMSHLEEQPDIAVITGIVLETEPTVRPDKIPAIDYSFYHNVGLTDIRFAGNAAIFRRSVLNQVGTWNPYIISDEEPELCLRIRHGGYRVVQIEYPVTRHYTTSSFEISTVLARRRLGLYLGPGQTIRYYLNSKLLLPYLRERGYALVGAATVLLAICSVALSCSLRNAFWVFAFLGLLALVIVVDSIRTRSFYRPVFHVLHRAVALEGTIKGLLMHRYRADAYPGKVTVVRTSAVTRSPVAK